MAKKRAKVFKEYDEAFIYCVLNKIPYLKVVGNKKEYMVVLKNKKILMV